MRYLGKGHNNLSWCQLVIATIYSALITHYRWHQELHVSSTYSLRQQHWGGLEDTGGPWDQPGPSTRAEGRQGDSRAAAELRELWTRMLKEYGEASCRAGWTTGRTALFTRAAAGRFWAEEWQPPEFCFKKIPLVMLQRMEHRRGYKLGSQLRVHCRDTCQTGWCLDWGGRSGCKDNH